MSAIEMSRRSGPLASIRIIATGGTIANTEGGRISVSQVLDDIRRHYPRAIDPSWSVSIDDIIREGAETFTEHEWAVIAAAVNRAAADTAVDGIVVAHGTYTAEETAYFLHLTAHTDKPLIVVSSQRKHATVGNDGDKNLIDAIRVASSPDARGRGALLLLHEEIHSARDVTKTNQRPGGFRSNSYGILGSVEVDRVSFYRSPLRRHTSHSEFFVPEDGALPRVDIAATYAGADGTAVDAFIAAGARGIVVNGFAFSGKPHHLQLPAIRRALEGGIAVVLANRGGDGRIPVDTGDGLVRGDSLSAQKARVLLTLALVEARDHNELQRIFDEY